jgi:NAD(P)-dependent dehydrogenase (short-subunit alcohol dehydrogenase family)/acyl carrier protein
MLQSAGRLYVRGAKFDWIGFDRPYSEYLRRVPLPTYPFQRQRYWTEKPAFFTSQGRAKSLPAADESPVLRLLNQGDTEQLAQLLETAGNLPEEKRKLLPEILNLLVEQHHQSREPEPFRNWFYRIEWRALSLSGESPAGDPWLIFADQKGIGAGVAALLKKHGIPCFCVYAGEQYHIRETGDRAVNPANPDDFVRLIRDISQENSPAGILHLWSLDAEGAENLGRHELEQAQTLGYESVLHLVQSCITYNTANRPRLWIVTQGAVSVEQHPVPLSPAQSPVWGLGNVIALEHPEIWGGLIDLSDTTRTDDHAKMLLAAISDSQKEDHMAFRNGKCYAARMTRDTDASCLTFQASRLTSDFSYLITGGMGALGLRIAKWMGEQGSRHLILTGRSGAGSSQAQEALKLMEKSGIHVIPVKADVSDEAAMTRVFEEIKTSMPPLRGVVHAAGLLDDGLLLQQSPERFRRVMLPKVQGTWNLHTLTRNLPLDFFICFSSAVSLIGSPGQGNYAAANAFQDSVAAYRRSHGLSGLSINWGPWADAGMAAGLDNRYQERLISRGIRPIDSEKGLNALGRLIRENSGSQVIVMPADWPVFSRSHAGRHQAFLSELLYDETAAPDTEQNIAAEFLQKLEALPADEQEAFLIAAIQTEAAAVLEYPPSLMPEPEQGFFEMGMDSLMAVEVKNRLEKLTGRLLPSTLAFEYPTIRALADFLLAEIFSSHDSVNTGTDIQEATETDPDMTDRLESLSEDEAEALLMEKLAALHD